MTGEEFGTTLRDMAVDIAEIKTNTEHMAKDIDGQHRTLFGREGRTGLVQEFESLKQSQSRWNKGLAIFPIVLVCLKNILGLDMGVKP